MKKHLFVGGPCDGKWNEVKQPLPLSLKIPVRSSIFFSAIRGYFTTRRIVSHEYYYTILHHAPDGTETAVYRHSSLSFQDIILRLLSHYTP